MLCKYFFFVIIENTYILQWMIFIQIIIPIIKFLFQLYFMSKKKIYICIEKRSTSIYNIILKIEKIIVYSCPEILLSKCCLKLLNYIIITFLYFWIDK